MTINRWRNRALRRVRGALAGSSPTPGPTPTPSITTITPAAAWTGTEGSGGGSAPTESDTMRTFGGKSWPGQPTIAPNIDDYMTVEDSAGYQLFVALEAGNDDGFDDCTIFFEGTTLTQAPFAIGDGTYGLAAILKGLSGKYGYANVTIDAKPKRGRNRVMTIPVWVNTEGALSRPTFYCSPTGSNGNTGLSAGSPWLDPAYAEKQPGNISAGHLATGWKIVYAAGAYKWNRGAAGNTDNLGPVTHQLASGLSPGDVIFSVNGSTLDRIVQHANRAEMWGIWSDHSLANGFTAVNGYQGVLVTRPGNLIFRDGCKLYDGASASGPLSNGYPEGTFGFVKAHRFFDPEGNFARVSAIGTAASPVTFETTHIAGMKAYIHCTGHFGWAGIFPRADARDSNLRMMFTSIDSYGNYPVRQHSAVNGTVSGYAFHAGSNTWRVSTNLVDLVDAPMIGTTPGVAYPGEYWALLFPQGGSTVAVGGGANYVGTLGPQWPLKRDGVTRDFPFYGWPVKGQLTAGGIVSLNNEPVGLTAGDLIRVIYIHGNDAIFVPQTGDDGSHTNWAVGNLENVTFFNSTIEHPEAQMISHPAGSGGSNMTIAAAGTLTYDGANTITASSAKVWTKGDTVTPDSGACANETAVIRKVNSTTSAELYDKLDGNGDPIRPFTTSFSGVSWSRGKSACVGMSWVNFFAWGRGGTDLDGAWVDWTIRSSTVALTSLTTLDLLFNILPTRRPAGVLNSVSIADSVISGMQPMSGASWPSTGVYARNNHYGRTPHRDTVGTGSTGTIDVSASFMVASVGKTASAAAYPYDRNGVLRVAGVSKVGSDIA